jgi:hypothetical protein
VFSTEQQLFAILVHKDIFQGLCFVPALMMEYGRSPDPRYTMKLPRSERAVAETNKFANEVIDRQFLDAQAESYNASDAFPIQ